MAIQFQGSELPGFENSEDVKSALEKVITQYGFAPGEIQYNFVSSMEIEKLNGEVLKHFYPTDIITFDDTVGKQIYCDVVICPEVIRENSAEFGESYEMELMRVMIHGLLHCMGYSDSTEKEKNKMRAAENHALDLIDVSRGTNRFL